jgi:hypothetical protein
MHSASDSFFPSYFDLFFPDIACSEETNATSRNEALFASDIIDYAPTVRETACAKTKFMTLKTLDYSCLTESHKNFDVYKTHDGQNVFRFPVTAAGRLDAMLLDRSKMFSVRHAKTWQLVAVVADRRCGVCSRRCNDETVLECLVCNNAVFCTTTCELLSRHDCECYRTSRIKHEKILLDALQYDSPMLVFENFLVCV